MRIELTSGHTVLADDADMDLLLPYSWYLCRSGGSGRLYAAARVRGTPVRVRMHRLLTSPPEDKIVHHKNNDGLDNRRCNLQVTTQRVNTLYAYMSANCVHLSRGRWRAQPRDENGNQVSLGCHDTEEKARAAVQNWKYRKMAELEKSDDQDLKDLAALLWESLGGQ